MVLIRRIVTALVFCDIDLPSSEKRSQWIKKKLEPFENSIEGSFRVEYSKNISLTTRREIYEIKFIVTGVNEREIRVFCENLFSTLENMDYFENNKQVTIRLIENVRIAYVFQQNVENIKDNKGKKSPNSSRSKIEKNKVKTKKNVKMRKSKTQPDNVIVKSKKQRCPNGYRRNKKTQNCESKNLPHSRASSSVQSTEQSKKRCPKRCPNGSRCNKKTQKCEKK